MQEINGLEKLAKLYEKVYVLRLGHRPERDKRITTHVALVSRAFGANGFVLEGICDDKVKDSLFKVSKSWGGKIDYLCNVNGKEFIKEWKMKGGEVINLTMYGLNVEDVIDYISISSKQKLIVVGAEKVERFYYDNSDYNIAIGWQPHSEVAALAIFLDRLYKGRELILNYRDATHKIIPTERGKRVERRQ
ncbi:MAG: tRNA (cytidine(56)-2'-O)-methyltransferase [Caldisphaera sp.]|nr:tRNA (cytidine(56)-2'-O)-methyltransferase [Caldisphaera sp.]